jgi:hypothetical protein
MFCGFVRAPAGPWKRVACGTTESAVWTLLLNDGAFKGMDKSVLPADREPRQRGDLGCPRPPRTDNPRTN